MVMGGNRKLTYLLLISFAVRALLAAVVELGDDEVYYRLYALYPDWSHFDHPPLVGWVIQLFSLNLLFDNELFIRLGSVVIGTVNTWVVYRLGCTLRSERAGWYAALLYTASVYCSVIVGIFIIPDTPLSLVWLLTIWLMVGVLPPGLEKRGRSDRAILAVGVLIGVGMLAKYTAIFLWLGAGAYILLYNRAWLKRWSLYAAVLLTAVCFLPVVIWNVQNDFISFTFHTSRVTVNAGASLFRIDYFAKELLGGILYNNPFVWGLVVATLVALFRARRTQLMDQSTHLLLWLSLPIIFVFIGTSLFRDTLPHWSAPGFFGLILLTAVRLDRERRHFSRPVAYGVGFLSVGLLVAVVAIFTGFLPMQQPEKEEDLGAWDFTLSMTGMKQAGEKFGTIHRDLVARGVMKADVPMVSDKWFPAAHLDFYVAKPNGLRLLTIGKLEDTHKYEWITRERGGFRLGEDAYAVVSSRFYGDVNESFGAYYESITPLDTIHVERLGKTVFNLYLYKLQNLVKLPPSQLPSRE